MAEAKEAQTPTAKTVVARYESNDDPVLPINAIAGSDADWTKFDLNRTPCV